MGFGTVVQARRQAMEMSLNVLSREMGGSPSPSFLSKIESGRIDASPRVAGRLADTLGLPLEVVLNAAGFTTEDQRTSALERLRAMVGAPAPVVMTIPVVDPSSPRDGAAGRRQRLVRVRDDYFLIDLVNTENTPFIGEVLVSLTRPPEEGMGVVVDIDGRASAWTYHNPGKPVGPYIENARGEKRAQGYEILGSIIRVVSELNF